MKFFRLLILAAGIPLFGFLIYRIGPGALWREFTLLGWAMPLFILLEGAGNILHAQAFRHCLSDSGRPPSFGRTFSVLMAGRSINYLTPTAGLGGELAKGLLLASDSTGTRAASAVLLDKLSCALSQLALILFGCCLFLSGSSMPRALWPVLIIFTAVVGSGIIGFYAAQRYGKLGAIVRWAAQHRFGAAGLSRTAGSLTELDHLLQRFHRERPLDFLLSMAWHFAGYLWGAVPMFYFLVSTGSSASLSTAGALTVLGIWFDLALFALPVDIGVQEATRILAFTITGYSSALGLTYGIARRIQQLFWAGIGLVVYGALLRGSTSLFRRPKVEPLDHGKEVSPFRGRAL